MSYLIFRIHLRCAIATMRKSRASRELVPAPPEYAEFMILLNGKYYTVDVGENGIFCKFRNEEGEHLGLYVGE